jgi:hypothetical protein
MASNLPNAVYSADLMTISGKTLIISTSGNITGNYNKVRLYQVPQGNITGNYNKVRLYQVPQGNLIQKIISFGTQQSNNLPNLNLNNFSMTTAGKTIILAATGSSGQYAPTIFEITLLLTTTMKVQCFII